VLALALAGVITLAAHADEVLVAAAVVLVQLLVAASPSLLTSSGEVVGSPRFAPAIVAGLVATVLTLEPQLLEGADGTSADVVDVADTGMFSAVLPAVMVAVFVALVAQMLRKDGRTQLVSSVGYAVTLAVVAALAVGWLGAAQSLGGAEVVAVGAGGLAAALLAWALPVDRWICLGLATVAGAAGGAAVAASVDSSMTILFGAVVGGGVGVFAVLGQLAGRVMADRSTHAAVRWGFPGAMSVACAAPIVYISGQLVTAPLLR
jgi:hypothetical protein